VFHSCLGAGVQRLAQEDVDHRFLEGRRHIRHRHVPALAPGELHPTRHGGLQAGEREVEPVPLQVAGAGQPTREVDGDLTGLRGPIDLGPAGEAEAQDAGHLVERLPGRIVDGHAQWLDVAGDVIDEQERRMPAGDEQRDRWLWQRPVLQTIHGDVCCEVVDPVERFVQCLRQRLRGCHPDQQCAGQAGARRDRQCVEIAQPDTRRGDGTLHGGAHRQDMGAAGHFRHDPTEAGVFAHRGGDFVSEQVAAGDYAHPRLIARRLDPQHQWRIHRASPPSGSDPNGSRSRRSIVMACRSVP
jgi:hypothetical protein